MEMPGVQPESPPNVSLCSPPSRRPRVKLKKPRELLRGEVGSPDASRATGREGDKQQKIKINKKPRATPALRLKASHPKAHRVRPGRTLPHRAAVPDAQTFATSPINPSGIATDPLKPSWDRHRPHKPCWDRHRPLSSQGRSAGLN